MAVTIDIVDGGSGKLTADGWEFTRVAVIKGVTGDGDARIYNAVVELVGVTGDIGAAHPTVLTTFLAEINAEPDATDIIRARLLYRTNQGTLTTNPTDPEDVLIRIGGRLMDRETNKDRHGELMEVRYVDGAGNTRKQTGTVGVLRPEYSLRFEVVMTAAELPGQVAKQFLGKVNSPGWWHDPETAADYKWLCTAVDGESRDGGATYQMTFEFQYREEGWDTTVAYNDPETGRVPPDVVDDLGIVDFEMYDDVDFNAAPFPVGNTP